ncbi:MAG: DUF3293 domain-containing protein [bacterium]
MKKVAKYVNESVEPLNEKGYARKLNILRGLVPSVDTVAFISAENPMNQSVSKQENKRRTKMLKKELDKNKMGHTKVYGKYGDEENTFFIPNISKEEALQLGNKYDQEAIIWATKIEGYDGMRFYMLFCDDDRYGEVGDTRDIFYGRPKDAEDEWTKVKGRKFKIPFFDDQRYTSDYKFKPESGVISKEGLSEKEINKIQKQKNIILEGNRNKKGKWMNRGYLQNLLRESYIRNKNKL